MTNINIQSAATAKAQHADWDNFTIAMGETLELAESTIGSIYKASPRKTRPDLQRLVPSALANIDEARRLMDAYATLLPRHTIDSSRQTADILVTELKEIWTKYVGGPFPGAVTMQRASYPCG